MTRHSLIVAVAALLVIACMGILKTVPVRSDKSDLRKLQTPEVSRKAEKQQDTLRTSPLHTATKNNKAIDVARLLIDGVDVNARDESGKTAIFYAAQNGNTGMAKLLLSRSADVKIASAQGLTPLHCATENGCVEMVKYLLNYGADINAVSSESGHSALFTARYKGYTNIARLLRAKGAVIDSIHTAAILGEFMETQKMLQKDITLARSVDKTNATPLHFAVYGGYKDIADLLLACGADINAKDTLGRTPLHFAANKQKTEAAVFLASKGANVDSQDNNKRTPLFMAVNTGNIDLASKLLAMGADPNIKDSKGNTPLVIAASLHRTDLTKLLLAGGSKIETVHDAALVGDISVMKNMLHAGADINVTDKQGRTPLSLATKQNDIRMVKFLLSRGAKDKPEAAPVKTANAADKKQVAALMRVYAGFTNAPVISEQ